MKVKQGMLLTIGLLVGLLGASFSMEANAASNTVPTKFQGTFYQYASHKKWDKLVIRKHSAQISGPGYGKAFKLKPTAKSSHKLAFKVTGKDRHQVFFTLNSKLKDEASSPLPMQGFSLAQRKIGHKTYKVVRGFQSGYWFDFIKGQKITHRYAGMANGKY